MKMVKAYIKKHKFNSVKIQLNKISVHGGVSGLSTYEVLGHGRGKAINVDNTITYEMHTFIQNICIEIACVDEIVSDVVQAIQSSANTGRSGDGKIFITHLENAIRISDGKEGLEVI